MKGLFYSIVSILFFLNCGLADLRNDLLREEKIPDAIQVQARDILSSPLDPYLDPKLWKDVRSMEIFLVDYWNSGLVRFFTPVPERVQAMRVNLSLEKNTIHIRFTDGKHRGRMVGVENGEPYTYDSKNGRVFNKDSEIQTYAESLRQYLILPFQVYQYKNLAYLGDMGFGNLEFHEIFATQGDWEATEQFDQYRIYIRKDSGKIEYIQFTYRDVFSFYKGILHYEDYTLINGRLFPMKIGIKGDFMDENHVHQLQIGTVKFLKEDINWED